MNQELWSKILAFDFDLPVSEYGFSTRLAKENNWTRHFTEAAILEYKKFMYLAATSDMMVSPSPIVDEVWHLHLLFTQSYTDFCEVIGKNVHHIPSTHNRSDEAKFRQAKERTQKLYTEAFGPQPSEIWDASDIYAPLQLPNGQYELWSGIIVGICLWIVLLFPFYFALKGLYIHIDNPYFLFGYLLLTVYTFLTLTRYNRTQLRETVNGFDKSAFVFRLHPIELVYLKTQKVSEVIHGFMNQLVKENKIIVNEDNSLEVATHAKPDTVEEYTIIETLSGMEKAFYPALLKQLQTKPIFTNIETSMEAFKKHFAKSHVFGKLFFLNFGILSFLLLLGTIRMATGIARDKPVELIGTFLILLLLVSIFFLIYLRNYLFSHTIPDLYRKQELHVHMPSDGWEWQYFLLGSAVYTTTFTPIASHADGSGSSSDGGGSSCGSDGGSCSSCGGCGGGD
ncbi:glycine-rich domain-containing protein [Xanthocytophaga flava]|uniref:glycine-rich domain-containing protein n=1 Tax=Xanthocytophaga flava TaxID=3048013 RepID=UPI0028D2D724|nr:hypothetical protein [Xanthocytophaga flavus]MDJ1472660.1 hypothetical protein [Xanthocytophaga flavus]